MNKLRKASTRIFYACVIVTLCSCAMPPANNAPPSKAPPAKPIAPSPTPQPQLPFTPPPASEEDPALKEEELKATFPDGIPPSAKLLASVPSVSLQGRSEIIPLSAPLPLGTGYSSLSGQLRAPSMTNEESSVKVSKGRAARYDLTYIASYSDLSKTLKVKASARYGAASASASLFKSSRVKRTKAYILVSMTVVSRTEYLAAYSLNDDALSSRPTPTTFSARYGDAFISSITYGGQLYALMEFSKDTGEDLEVFKASVKGGAGSFSAKASMEQSLRKLVGSRNVKIIYVQSGGNAGEPVQRNELSDKPRQVDDPLEPRMKGGLLTMTPDELLERVRRFPGEVYASDENSSAIYGITRDYTVASNFPTDPKLEPALQASWLVEDLGAAYAMIIEELATVEDFVETAAADKSAPVAQLAEARRQLPYLQYASKEVDRMIDTALAAPSYVVPLSKNFWLETYDFYKRKKVASPVVLTPDKKKEGDMCALAQPDQSELGECLFGKRVKTTMAIPLDKVKVDPNSYRVVVGQKQEWVNTIGQFIPTYFFGKELIDCYADRQTKADAICGKKDANDHSVLAVIRQVPGTPLVYGDRCGYTPYNVFCMRTDITVQDVVAPSHTYTKETDYTLELKGSHTGPNNTVVATISVSPPPSKVCNETFGQYKLTLASMSGQWKSVTDSWRTASAHKFELTSEIQLEPTFDADLDSLTVTPMVTLCIDPIPNS